MSYKSSKADVKATGDEEQSKREEERNGREKSSQCRDKCQVRVSKKICIAKIAIRDTKEKLEIKQKKEEFKGL
jgi:hypothetical protein